MKQQFLELIKRKQNEPQHYEVQKVLEELRSEVEKIKERDESQWNSVKERLPTIPDEHYLVCVKNKNKED